MYDYKGIHELKDFYSIQETCDLLKLDENKLRYRCLRHILFPRINEEGILGFDKRSFQELNNGLYEDQCREGVDEGDPWE